jgi:preprotein translocase subunit SecE
MKIPIWDGAEPKTRRIIVVIVGVVIVAAMITGNFDTLIRLFK